MFSKREHRNAGRLPVIHEGHVAPLIQILGWLFLAFSVISVAAQIATKKFMQRRLVGADFVLIAALVLAIGQTVSLISPAGQAIGNSQAGLSEETIMQAWKALYSSEILAILTLVASKSSLLVPLMTLTPVSKHRRMIYTASIVTVLWGISSVLLIAFQCSSPHRWDLTNPTCLDLRSIRIYGAIMNIITDLALAIIPTLMVLSVQIASDTRLTLILAFWARILVVFASVAQISFIYTLDTQHEDLLNAIWRIVVCAQAVQVLSIATSTIPFLKSFLMSLESGFLGAEKAVGRRAASQYTSGSSPGHLSSYIKIDSQQSHQVSVTTKDKDIWVRHDVLVKREPSIELVLVKGHEGREK